MLRSRFFCVALLCSFLVIHASAQDASTGAIRGSVSDSSGSFISGANVAVVQANTGRSYSVSSNEQGQFVVDLLPPGDYSARAEFPGMSPQITPQLHVGVGVTTELSFRLTVAGAKETMTVSEVPPLVETEPTAISSYVDERAVSDLPLNGRRFTDLALLAPGVSQDPRGLTSSSSGDLAFGGIRGYQSSYLVDGSDNNNAFFAQARGRYRAPYQFSNEVVQEFRVSSNTYGAELGRAGGAVVNVVTKSGSNSFHGTTFYFVRDSSLNAQHPFMDIKPADRQQQFGFTVGGPIRKNRVFFFGGFDQHVFRVPMVVRFVNGGTKVLPLKGEEPLHHGDYEDSDKALVYAAADQLSQMSGQYQSAQIGNTGFLKVDANLSPKHFLSLRVSTSRYYGQNNVFLDPASPITTYAISDNGEEDVATETGSIALTSSVSSHLISHLRAQFSRDDQSSRSNSEAVLTRITGVLDGFGRSTILPRQTREHRLHLAETFSREGGRYSWKFGGDALLSWIYNYFPSQFGGEYIFDAIKVNPWTFDPMVAGMQITPLRAYAHGVPRYYVQNFGSAVSNPDTNDFSAFLQDTVRATKRLGLSLGIRYDVQTFSRKGIVSNPLWPASGRVPLDKNNFSPRVGFAYSLGNDRPLVVRGGYGLFFTRIPQIYTSSIATDNGISSYSIILDNADYYEHKVFPQYPNPLVSCGPGARKCVPPTNLLPYTGAELSTFASNYKTPKVEQASLTLEKEVAHRLAIGAAYMYVHGENMLRARDVNLPEPLDVTYPVYDESGTNLLGYYNTASFSTWQYRQTLDCAYPPCINPLVRPVSQLGAINEFDTASSSVYHGLTVSVRRQMTSGFYFRLAYTYAHAIDDGQDALVAGRPATVQNSYSTASERASSVTDQRHRVAVSWVYETRFFYRRHEFLGKLFNLWKVSGVTTVGSGRPLDARVYGDPNRDGNSGNDRLPGYGRNAFVGPDYATVDMRLSRRLFAHNHLKLDLMVESFNLLNRDNQRVRISDDGYSNNAGSFVQVDNRIGINYFPGQYRRTASFAKATDAYAPRQMQLALKLTF